MDKSTSTFDDKAILLKDFYQLRKLRQLDNLVIAYVTINKSHDVFAGHFPGNPVTPGVCMIQIIKEILTNNFTKTLFLKECTNVKFMSVINPFLNDEVEINIEILQRSEEAVKIKASANHNGNAAIKMSALFSVIS